MTKCEYHLCEKQTSNRFCSKLCNNKFNVANRRRRLKILAVEELGGRCVKCGYDNCIAALEFHHLANKNFGISSRGLTRSWNKLKEELKNCILVCANCHRETHHQYLGS